jgi:hypothetical protein
VRVPVALVMRADPRHASEQVVHGGEVAVADDAEPLGVAREEGLLLLGLVADDVDMGLRFHGRAPFKGIGGRSVG